MVNKLVPGSVDLTQENFSQQSNTGKLPTEKGSNFQDVMEKKGQSISLDAASPVTGPQQTTTAQNLAENPNFQSLPINSTDNKGVGVNSAQASSLVPPVNSSQQAENIKGDASPTNSSGNGLKGVINAMVGGENSMNSIMKVALGNPNLTSTQMIALQAATYNASMTLTATTKLAETASNSIKTTMQQQV